MNKTQQASDKEEKRTVHIFWTGGYDSTFRVTQLSQKDVNIAPYYLKFRRQSTPNELEAMEKITNLLKQNPKTKCTFSPLQVIDAEEYTVDPAVKQAYKRIRETMYVGSQYVKLASYALNHPGFELSVHKDDKAIAVINAQGKLKKIEDEEIGTYYIVDQENSSEDVCTMFSNFCFPLTDITKLQMKQWYIENGYEEVMNSTWFCHKPRNGKPCGVCNPCKYTIEEGMKERLPKRALIRYYIKYSPVSKTVRKLVRKVYPAK